MKKLLIATLATSTILLQGCFETTKYDKIKNSYCSDVPKERYDNVIGATEAFFGGGREKAAEELEKFGKDKGITCDEAISRIEVLGFLLLFAVSHN